MGIEVGLRLVLIFCTYDTFFLREISVLRRFSGFVEQRAGFLHAAALIAFDATACSYSDFVFSEGPMIPHIYEPNSTQEIPHFNYDGPSSCVFLYPMTYSILGTI